MNLIFTSQQNPWEPHENQGKGKGRGRGGDDMPVVPEPEFYGVALMVVLLALIARKRFKR